MEIPNGRCGLDLNVLPHHDFVPGRKPHGEIEAEGDNHTACHHSFDEQRRQHGGANPVSLTRKRQPSPMRPPEQAGRATGRACPLPSGGDFG